MRKILTIATREFVETVKTRAFFISVVLVPLLIMLLVMGGQWIKQAAEKEKQPPRRIAVVDHTESVLAELLAQVTRFNRQNPNRPFELEPLPISPVELTALRDRVRRGELYAYIVVPREVVGGDAACELGRKDDQLETGQALETMITEAVIAVRFQQADPPVDRGYVNRLQRPVGVNDVDVRSGQPTAAHAAARLLTPFAFMFLLFMGTLQISYGLLTSVIEEKGSRVVEVLLSAVSPGQLMTGKILGMVAVGLALLGVWGSVGYGAVHARGVEYLVTASRLTYFGLYFFPGFLLFSAFLAAVGSTCNTIKEAQSVASPLSLMTIVPMILWWQISQNPTSLLSVALSYIPPITPFVMILRICADPDTPLWQIATTLLLLWAAVGGTIWAAGKVFRIGVLMYGKPPSLRELARWVRYA